jgi:tetratricopeptide (TPR) repeat protein
MSLRSIGFAALAATLSAAVAAPASAQSALRVGLVEWPNSGAPAAQEDFIYGVAQLHNFQYADAAAAFRRAQEADPDFALAYWGEAMTHNHTVWEEQDRRAALEALQKLGPTPEARIAKAPAGRERDLMAAVEVLYGEGSKPDRDDVYARRMQELHARYPDDPEVAAFTALAILGTAHEGRDFATYMRAAAIVEEVFDANPRHPGAAHYLIHSYDDPVHAPLGLRAARAYSVIAPESSHAQHMVSHIFVASGMWEDVVEANLNSVAAGNRARGFDTRDVRGCGHAVTWLNYGYLQLGRAEDAARITGICHAQALQEVDPEPVFDPDLSRQASFITMWARYAVDTEDFDSPTLRLSVELRSDQVQERMTVAYVHGLAAARAGAVDAVRDALETIRETRAGTERLVAESDRTFELEAVARSEVLEHQMAALLAQVEGRPDQAIAHARAAAERESRMPFMFGPPFVDKPSLELLGEILLAAGKKQEAETAFRDALLRVPGRTMSLEGLAAATR